MPTIKQKETQGHAELRKTGSGKTGSGLTFYTKKEFPVPKPVGSIRKDGVKGKTGSGLTFYTKKEFPVPKPVGSISTTKTWCYSITLENAMKSVGTGLVEMQKAEAGLKTGLIPSEVSVTFNISASATNIGAEAGKATFEIPSP